MGSIFQRGNKFYYCFKGADGKWIKKVGGNTQEEARLHLEAAERGETVAADSTLAPLAAAYLKKLSIYAKPRSYKSAESSCRHLLKHFAEHPFNQVGLDAFVSTQLALVRPKSVNNSLIVLRAIVNYALESRLLQEAPFRVRLLKVAKKRVLPVLGKEEVERLLSAAKDPYYGILLVACYTGFRLSEILNLVWREVGFQDYSLSVTEKNGWTAKSHQERTVFVPVQVIEYLVSRREKSSLKGVEDYVFGTRAGFPISPSNACRSLRKVFKEAGLYQKGRPLSHLLRHSFISQLIMSGCDLETTREISGHSSLTTLSLYSRTVSAKKKEAVTLLPW